MSRLKKRQQRHCDILNAAEEVIIEKGLFSFSLLEVSKRTGCSVNTLYNHFNSREDIAISLFNRLLAKWCILANEEIESLPGSPAEHLMAMLLIWPYRQHEAMEHFGIQFLTAMPVVWKSASHQPISVARQLLRLWNDMAMSMLEQAVLSGELSADPQTMKSSLRKAFIVDRGFSILSNNYLMRDDMVTDSFSTVYDLVVCAIMDLKWQEPLNINSYGRIKKVLDLVIERLENRDVDEFLFELEASYTG